MKYEAKFKNFVMSADTDKNTMKIERIDTLGEAQIPEKGDFVSICRILESIMYTRNTIFTLSIEEFAEFQKSKKNLHKIYRSNIIKMKSFYYIIVYIYEARHNRLLKHICVSIYGQKGILL